MTWAQIFAQAAIMATFLGAGVAIAAYLNGKHIKSGVKEIGEMIKEMRREFTELMVQMNKQAEERHKEIMDKLK